MNIVPTIGEHIYRKGNSRSIEYTHHGIVIGKDEVIHFFKREGDQKHIVQSTTLQVFADGKAIERKEYIRIIEEIEDITGEKLPDYVADDIRAKVEDVAGAVRRAKNLLGEGGYGLTTKNCEHIAMYCKTGHHFSHQVGLLGKLFRMIASRS